MKFLKLFPLVLFSFLVVSHSAMALDIVKPAAVDYSNLHYNQSLMWGQDVMVAASEPEGPIAGAYASNGTIWLAINDTTINPGKSILFYKTSNGGANWTLSPTAIQPAMIIDQIKMLRAGDSTYCFFRTGTTIYKFNVGNNSFAALPQTAVTQFDIVASSTNSLYLYYSNATQVLRTGSIDGGFTWINNGTVSTAILPTLGISATGDTLDVLYRATGGTNTAITRFRYRETSAGTVAFLGSATAVLTAGVNRTQYRSFRYGASEWIVYTEGDSPNTELKCLISTDGGTTYGTPVTINVTPPGADHIWFTGGISNGGNFRGIDLFYVKDSSGTSNDNLLYSYAAAGTTSFPSTRAQIGDFNAAVSPRNYIPSAIELPNSNVGVAYVGVNGGSRNVYWDKLTTLTGIHPASGTAENYDLKQNYPNPFNPSTTISFSLPKSDFVSLKVFDVTGKEVADLISKKLTEGNYDVKFDAGKLTSGVYFYKLITGDFVSTKKMMLVK